MAFSLRRFDASGIDVGGSVRRRLQRAAFTIVATTADVDLDIGDDSGTFWTAAVADATYGVLASNVLAWLQALDDNVAALLDVQSPQLLDRVQTAAASGNGEFARAIQNHRPNITVNAADGETSWFIECIWELADNIPPQNQSYG